MKDEKPSTRHKEILRFILIARLFDFQIYTFSKGLKQEMKRRMNLFTAALNSILALLKTNLPPEYEDYLDNTAAGAWEVLEEYDKAPDKAMFLTVCQCYNQGLIRLEDENLPINSHEFQDLLKAKAKAA